MIWVKTDAGRAELQHRTHLHDRHLRAVLELVDGKKLEDGLLRTLPGSSPEDLKELQRLGLIEPLSAVAGAGSHTTAAPGVPSAALPARNVSPEQFEALTAELRRVISAHLGLGGLSLTLALEQARTTEELVQVAKRTVEQIEGRRGPSAAAETREALRPLLDE
jgi:hypothetical protein